MFRNKTNCILATLVVIAVPTWVWAETLTIPATNAAGSSAAVTTFTDRMAWEAAIGGSPGLHVDFDGVTVDTSFLGTPFDVGPFVLLASSTSDELGLIDAAPFLFGELFAIDGTTYALSDVDLHVGGEG